MLTFSTKDQVATIALDDGKANAVGHAFIDAVNEGLDQAEQKAKAVVITGRPGLFSAGFDLKEIDKGPAQAAALVNKGGHMLLRIFSHPQPVIIACAGHAIAAGAFMLLAADTRIGVAGEFKIGLNETAIGMSLPVFGHQLAGARLSKRHQTASLIQGQLFDPEQAQDAGFLDRVVQPDELQSEIEALAQELAELPGSAYAANKKDFRAPYIEAIKASLT